MGRKRGRLGGDGGLFVNVIGMNYHRGSMVSYVTATTGQRRELDWRRGNFLLSTCLRDSTRALFHWTDRWAICLGAFTLSLRLLWLH